jgi:Haem-binding domain
MLKRIFTLGFLFRGMLVAIGLFALIQVIPLGRNHANPDVLNEPKWDSTDTRALFKRACFDCHSNETNWPWYSNLAPMSWMLQMDVDNARANMNFSEWDESNGINADLIARKVANNEMPKARYLMLHPEARLTQAEKDQLIQGIRLTLSNP